MQKTIMSNERIINQHEYIVSDVDFKMISLMCPHCFEYINNIRMRKNISLVFDFDNNSNPLNENSFKHNVSYNINGFCKTCNKKISYIIIDNNIANIISILNKKRYYTEYCCEAHSWFDNAYIKFSIDMYDIIDNYPLPKYWKLEENNVCIRCYIEDILSDNGKKELDRCKKNNLIVENNEYLNTLYAWAESLPENEVFKYLIHKGNYAKVISNCKSKGKVGKVMSIFKRDNKQYAQLDLGNTTIGDFSRKQCNVYLINNIEKILNYSGN